MNALDLALNGAAGKNAIADPTSIVYQLVKAGATMTGNSKAWQRKSNPALWGGWRSLVLAPPPMVLARQHDSSKNFVVA